MAALVAVFLLAASPARAVWCTTHKVIANAISKYDGERLWFFGISDDRRAVVEIFVNPLTGSFTIVTTRVGAYSCVTFSGKQWSEAGGRA